MGMNIKVRLLNFFTFLQPVALVHIQFLDSGTASRSCSYHTNEDYMTKYPLFFIHCKLSANRYSSSQLTRYWFPATGLPGFFLISSHPLTHGCPGIARVSGAAWLLRLFMILSRTAENTYTNRVQYKDAVSKENRYTKHQVLQSSFISYLTGFVLTASGGCSWPVNHFQRSGFSCTIETG